MIAYHVVALVCGVVGILTSMVGSSACFYNAYTTSGNSFAILEQKVKDLKQLLEEIQLKLNENGVLRPVPLEWIRNVNSFLDENREMDLGGRLHESCMNICLVCETWKSIVKSTREVDKLLKEGEGIKLVGIRRSGSRKTDVFGEDVENITGKIWNEVSQETGVQVVCIHGIAGVGKTVVASAIHDKALENIEDLQNVIWVSIEYGWVMKDIQEEIGRQLPSDLSSCTDDIGRAARLQAVLTSKKFLLVLDNLPMWQDFILDHIGIPGSNNSWKLIVASRSYSACRKVRGSISATSRIYEIKPLPQDKAWKLFEHVAGPNRRHLKDKTIQDTKLAVKDLDGLPSAIEMLAKALKEIPDDNPTGIINAWNRELLALCSSGSLLGKKSQEFFDGFKDIFEKLGQVPLSCFVYCLLFPKGYIFKAKELIEYWMWEELLGEVSCLEETMGNGWEVLYYLRDAHLLEIIVEDEGRPEEYVRMLNVIRLVAMNADVIKSGHQDFINCGNSLKELPLAKDWPANTRRATFVQNEVRALQNSPDCRILSTLLMQDNPLDSKSNKKFFSKLVNLRVLDLSCTRISSLPTSLSGLKKLYALLLRNCEKLTSLPSLSNLQKLLVLDLSGTPLTEFPRGLNNLTNLRRLNLSCTKLQTLEAAEVGQLTQLEELLLMCNREGNLIWGSDKIYPDRKGLCIEEIINLGRLVVLQLNFSDTAVFRNFLRTAEFEKNVVRVTKRSFKFCVGEIYDNGDHVVGDNSLTIIRDHSATLPKETAELHWIRCAQKLPSLNIDGCLGYLSILDISDFDDLECVLTREMLNNLTELKEIRVRRCQKTVSIIKPDAEARHADIIAIPKLTTLLLCDLPKLKRICDCQELNFPFLTEVKVLNCEIMELPEIPPAGERKILVKGYTNWLERARNRNPSSSSIFIYEEIPQPISSTSGSPPVQPVQPFNRTGDAVPSHWDRLRRMFWDGRLRRIF